MDDIKNIVKGLWAHGYADCRSCPYWGSAEDGTSDCKRLAIDALTLLKKQKMEIKALRLLLKWATECDFGYDQFQDEYERYKDEIQDMSYIDGMVHVVKRTLEDHGVFE